MGFHEANPVLFGPPPIPSYPSPSLSLCILLFFFDFFPCAAPNHLKSPHQNTLPFSPFPLLPLFFVKVRAYVFLWLMHCSPASALTGLFSWICGPFLFLFSGKLHPPLVVPPFPYSLAGGDGTVGGRRVVALRFLEYPN